MSHQEPLDLQRMQKSEAINEGRVTTKDTTYPITSKIVLTWLY